MRIFPIIPLVPCYLLKSQVKVITINDRVNEFILIKGISNNILVTQPKKKATLTIRTKYGQINKIAAGQFLHTVNYLGSTKHHIFNILITNMLQ